MIFAGACSRTSGGNAASTTAAGSNATHVGLGSPLSRWNATYRDDSTSPICAESGYKCFGPTIHNSETTEPQFTEVYVSYPGAIITGYRETFPNGTTEGEAVSMIMGMLPQDVKEPQSPMSNGHCGIADLTSVTLDVELSHAHISQNGPGGVTIGLSSHATFSYSAYTPSSVLSASVGIGYGNPVLFGPINYGAPISQNNPSSNCRVG